MRFALTEEEYEELSAAPPEAGWRAERTPRRPRCRRRAEHAVPADSALRDALGELIRSAGLVRRIGVNLNQAVAKLNATGQRSGDLVPYAAESLRRAERLDAAAEHIRRRLR